MLLKSEYLLIFPITAMLLKSIYSRLLELLVKALNRKFTPNNSNMGHVTQIYISSVTITPS